MKRKLLFAATLVAGLLGGISTASAQENIIKDWDGRNSTEKTPDKFGWYSSARTWGEENAGSGIRFKTDYTGYKLADGTSYTYTANSEPSTKILWIRYNSEYYTYSFTGLEPDHSYTFSGLVGWNSNSSNPSFTIGVENEGGKTFNSASTGTINKQTTLYDISFGFTVPADDASETFKLRFTCGVSGDCIEAVSALSIVEDLSAYKPRLEGKIAEAKSVPGDNADLKAAISAAESVTKGTVAYDDMKNQIAALDKAIADARAENKEEAIKTAGTEAAPADWTGAVVNPSFEEYEALVGTTAGGSQFVPTGWTESKVWTSDLWMYSGKSDEYNKEGDNSYKVRFNWASDTYSISQTITDLPRGKYKLTAYVKNSNTKGSKSNAKISINNDEFKTESETITEEKCLELDFFLTEERDIDIKLTSTYIFPNNGESAEGILYWDDIRLYNYGTEALEAAELEAAQKELEALIETAKVPTANIGTGAFQFPQDAVTALSTAISDANSKTESTDINEVKDALAELQKAMNIKVNEPAVGARFTISTASTTHKYYNSAVAATLGTTGDNNKTGYTFGAATTKNVGNGVNVNRPQAFIFTNANDEEHPNYYYISVERAEGTVYLTNGTKNNSAAGWASQQIQGTTSEDAKLAFEIIPLLTEEGFNLKNTDCTVGTALVALQANDNGSLYTEDSNNNLLFTEAEKASVSISVSADKYATAIFPFVPTLPDGVVANTVAIDGDKVELTPAETLEANVPYVLSATKEVSEDVKGFGIADKDSYTDAAGILTGVYTESTVDAGNYVLQTQEGVQAFYQVADGSTLTAVPYRAYLTVPVVGVKAFYFGTNGDATAIKGVETAEGAKNAVIYNLAGQRVVNPTKGGIYIVNGQKVLVK